MMWNGDGKKFIDVNSFINTIKNIKEMISCFRDKNRKTKKRYKFYKTLSTMLESVDTIFNIGAISTSITLTITGIGLIVLPMTAGIACALSTSRKVLHKIIKNKYNKYEKQYQKGHQIIKVLINYIKKVCKII